MKCDYCGESDPGRLAPGPDAEHEFLLTHKRLPASRADWDEIDPRRELPARCWDEDRCLARASGKGAAYATRELSAALSAAYQSGQDDMMALLAAAQVQSAPPSSTVPVSWPAQLPPAPRRPAQERPRRRRVYRRPQLTSPMAVARRQARRRSGR